MSNLELNVLEQYIKEVSDRFQERRRLRDLNSPENCQNSVNVSNLDSSIKKNSAFVKRLRGYCESQRVQILDEIDRLNLTKFISEIAASIVEAKIKLSDVPTVVEICNKLNRNYKEFSKQLLDQYSRYFPTVRKKNHDYSSFGQNISNQSGALASNLTKVSSLKSGSSDVSSLNLSKIRVDLRLFSELLISGIIPLKEGFPVLMNLLCFLMVHDKNAHQNASAILTFCKGCGEELMGLVPKDIQQLATKYNRELPVNDFISAKRQSILKGYIRDYYQWLVRYLRNTYEDLEQLINKNKRTCKTKGEVSKDIREIIDTKIGDLRKTQGVVCQLADLLGEEQPCSTDIEYLLDTTDPVSRTLVEGSSDSSQPASFKTSSIWDDEGTRAFYEDLLDLRQIFPELIKKLGREQTKDENTKSKSPTQDDKAKANLDVEKLTDKGVESLNSKKADDSSEIINTLESSSSDENVATGESSSSQREAILSRQNRTQPDQFFVQLSNCVNRDMIDSAAVDFIKFFNTKFGRKKLIRTLFSVQRTRLDLLPFYARLTATIHPFVPSVGNELVSLLKVEFRNLFKKKDQINIESKVKNVRFIGELVKFGLFTKQDALHCLKLLLSDFTHHHIEMTCNMLETCGRLLYKSAESHSQLNLLLEQMMRKKLLLSVDSKYITMIENAYYFTNPPELVKHIVEEPPIYNYVRYLLYERLNRSTIDIVLQKIKLLDWNDKKLVKFIICCMTEAYNLKFYNTRYLAALLAALNKDHNWVSILVVDSVVEDILLMMEINEIYFNQRRIPMIRYFGELYNYRLTDSSLVFKILYSLITYEVFYPEPGQTLNQIVMSRLDPPDNLFRIKLVCDLLDTCGQYLSSSQEKRKLDCYLLFFQRYHWCKKHIYTLHPYCMAKSGNQFPASIEFLYNDVIYNLRPTFVMASSYSHAIQLLQEFLNNLAVEE